MATLSPEPLLLVDLVYVVVLLLLLLLWIVT
jgi:hypothetical protein